MPESTASRVRKCHRTRAVGIIAFLALRACALRQSRCLAAAPFGSRALRQSRGCSSQSVFHSGSVGEFFHRFFLLFCELLRNTHLNLDDQVAALIVPFDPLLTHAEALSVRGARGNLDRDFLSVE